MKIELLYYTPIEIIATATAIPYQSKESNKLVERVWNTGHKSIARHSSAVFLIKDVSQSLLRQISRHSHINLTVKSSRYCDMSNVKPYIPQWIQNDKLLQEEFMQDYKEVMDIYTKWKGIEIDYHIKDTAKLFLPLASTTDLVLSGNYQALYEFCQLRNCCRAEEEIRNLSLQITNILKEKIPEIFNNLGCRGDELGYCPELHGSCNKYPLKGK